jgi:hypothetical protein
LPVTPRDENNHQNDGNYYKKSKQKFNLIFLKSTLVKTNEITLLFLIAYSQADFYSENIKILTVINSFLGKMKIEEKNDSRIHQVGKLFTLFLAFGFSISKFVAFELCQTLFLIKLKCFLYFLLDVRGGILGFRGT